VPSPGQPEQRVDARGYFLEYSGIDIFDLTTLQRAEVPPNDIQHHCSSSLRRSQWLICNCKNGIGSYEIARDLGITQKSAWFLDHRIRAAMQSGSFNKLSGEIEADETFIGGKARNMHAGKRARRITGTGGKDKTAVMGILERGGKVRTTVIPNRKKKAIQAEVKKHVEAGSALYTDALQSLR
jgi:hypothetical protein